MNKNQKALSLFHRIRLFLGTRKGIFILGCILGLGVFGILFGFATVNPTNISWITNMHGDIVQHYIGWLYYRDSSWQFPNVGHIDGLAYPTGISLVYMDVIPLFAIFFKIFSGILPEHFQYLGLFTALSYMLQGGLASLILSRFTKRPLLAILGGLLIVLTPIIISRSFAHTALTAHWLVLLGIYLLFKFKQDRVRVRYQIIAWSVALCLAVLTHAYFIPIVGFLFALSIVQQYKSIKSSAPVLILPIVAMVVTFALIGGLTPGMATNGGSGLGLYSLNAFGLFIPMGYSYFLTTPFQHVQWEGLAYLGVGTLLLLVVSLTFWISNQKSFKKILKYTREAITRKRILTIVAGVALFLAALSPIIYIGDWHVLTIPTGSLIDHAWGIFRSTGRLFWPLYYLLIIGILIYIFKKTERWSLGAATILIVAFVALQAIDVLRSPATVLKQTSVESSLATAKSDTFNQTFISQYCDKQTVVVVDNSIEAGIKLFEDMPNYIISCHPNLTTGYFARFPKTAILKYTDQQRTQLIKGTLKLSQDSLYITQSREFTQEIDKKYKSIQYGDYWVITTR